MTKHQTTTTIAIVKSADDTPIYKVYRVTNTPMSHTSATKRELVLETEDLARVTRIINEW